MNHNTFRTIFMLSGFLFLIGACVIIYLIIRSIWRAFKSFLFELVDHIKGTAPRTNTSNTKYIAEARKACENVTPKQKQDETPPWEQ